MTPLKSQAIQLALIGNWAEAVSINQQILLETPEDIDTLNRLAFAYASLGNAKDAKTTYQKVLELDGQNVIATKNLKRVSLLSSRSSTQASPRNNIFIEESGKTKVLDLLNVAEQKVISPLQSGEKLQLQVKRNKIFVLDHIKQYLGMLPEDLGKRLINFIEGGNEYEAFVKIVNNHKVTILLRESKRANQFTHQPSFVLTDKVKLQIDGKSLKHAAKRQEVEDDDSRSDDDSDTELL